METRVVYLEGEGKISIKKMSLPELKPNQVLVKTHQASVCGSERYFYRGITVRPEDEARGSDDEMSARQDGKPRHAYPIGPWGHEGGGTIIEVGSAVEEYLGGGRVKVGDRVGSLVYPTYSDYWVTDPARVQPIPEGVSFEVGCLYEALGCAGWAAIHMGVKLGDTVAVNGVGFAGNIMLQGAVKAGASKVIAVDVQQSKLDIAKKLGADHIINAKEVDPVQMVLELTHGVGVDVAPRVEQGDTVHLARLDLQLGHAPPAPSRSARPPADYTPSWGQFRSRRPSATSRRIWASSSSAPAKRLSPRILASKSRRRREP